jgi:hypothetical protein
MVNVCGVAELLNVLTIGVERPPPDGVIVIVPVYVSSGVTENVVEAVNRAPPLGPVSV